MYDCHLWRETPGDITFCALCIPAQHSLGIVNLHMVELPIFCLNDMSRLMYRVGQYHLNPSSSKSAPRGLIFSYFGLSRNLNLLIILDVKF